VVFGKVGGSILLLCRNVSKEATEVLWFQGDPHSFPPLFSSRVAFPPDVRFSLVDNSSLRISELRLQDEGNYTCKEVLNKTEHEHRVQLLVASKSVPWLNFHPQVARVPFPFLIHSLRSLRRPSDLGLRPAVLHANHRVWKREGLLPVLLHCQSVLHQVFLFFADLSVNICRVMPVFCLHSGCCFFVGVC